MLEFFALLFMYCSCAIMIVLSIARFGRFFRYRKPPRHLAILFACGLVMIIAGKAHAGGYGCYSCNHAYVQQQVVTYPQTIIEHQNNEIFYQVPNAVQQYAVTPGAIAAAHAGEIQRQIGSLQDQLADYRQAQQQVQPQMVYCVPMQAQAAYCPPGQQPAAMPQQPAAQPQQPQQPPQSAPGAPPQRFSDRAPQSIIQAACVKCHGGAAVKGELDFTRDLTCEQKQLALVKAAAGDMPKGGPKLSPEQFMQLAKEIAALHTAGASSGGNDAQPAE